MRYNFLKFKRLGFLFLLFLSLSLTACLPLSKKNDEKEPIMMYLKVFSNNDDYGSTKGSGEHELFSETTIEAIPNEGYYFDSWSDGSTSNPRTYHIGYDSYIIDAIFKEGTIYEIKNEDYLYNHYITVTNGTLEIIGNYVSLIPNNKDSFGYLEKDGKFYSASKNNGFLISESRNDAHYVFHDTAAGMIGLTYKTENDFNTVHSLIDKNLTFESFNTLIAKNYAHDYFHFVYPPVDIYYDPILYNIEFKNTQNDRDAYQANLSLSHFPYYTSYKVYRNLYDNKLYVQLEGESVFVVPNGTEISHNIESSIFRRNSNVIKTDKIIVTF